MLTFLESGIKEKLTEVSKPAEPEQKKFMTKHEFRQMHVTDEDSEIAQDARNMTDNEFYDKYKHIR